MKRLFQGVFWDDKTRKHYVYRPDCPDDLYHEISLDAAIDLSKQLARYECDVLKEKNLI